MKRVKKPASSVPMRADENEMSETDVIDASHALSQWIASQGIENMGDMKNVFAKTIARLVVSSIDEKRQMEFLWDFGTEMGKQLKNYLEIKHGLKK